MGDWINPHLELQWVFMAAACGICVFMVINVSQYNTVANCCVFDKFPDNNRAEEGVTQ